VDCSRWEDAVDKDDEPIFGSTKPTSVRVDIDDFEVEYVVV
jgi:hypothetical protein